MERKSRQQEISEALMAADMASMSLQKAEELLQKASSWGESGICWAEDFSAPCLSITGWMRPRQPMKEGKGTSAQTRENCWM